ncbi:tyrosine-type recombinase/integrase [Planctomycetota bacterium]
MLRFACFVDEQGHVGPLTIAMALQWARLPKNASPLYQARRLEVVRCFAKYLAIFDENTGIPPSRLLGKAHQRMRPHIYSEADILALFDAAETLRPTHGIRPQTFRVLIGLLCSTGLRISEALRLMQKDVDLKSGILTIAETKFYKSRLVPVHASTKRRLQDYQFNDSNSSEKR